MTSQNKVYLMQLTTFIKAVDYFRKTLEYLEVLITQDKNGDYSRAHLDICHAISRIDTHLTFLLKDIGRLPCTESTIKLPGQVAKDLGRYVDATNSAIERLRRHNIVLTEN